MLRSMARTYGLRRSEMAESINISRLRGPSTLLRYGLAVLAVSAATIIQQLGDQHFAVTPSYFCAVLLTAWLGDLGPALFAIALSNLALMYYFVPPTQTFVIDAKYIASLILFSLAALFVTWLTRSLVYARNQLDLKVHEINKTNEALQAEITERKRAEEALMRSKDYLAEAQKLTHTGSLAWDPRTEQVQYCSEEMFHIYGLDPRPGLPSRENFRQQIHPEDRDRVKERFEESLRKKIDTSAEYRVLLLDGTVRQIGASVHPVLNEGGELIQFVDTAVDVTERKQAEESLRESEVNLAHMNRVSTMGELVASLSHEITQPIASARNNARAAQNFLKMQPPDLGEVMEALACAVGDTDRAGNIIDRIRAHVKKAPPRMERFDLNVAINEMVVLARSAINRYGVSVQTRLSEGLVQIQGDRVQLQQVLLNLILNATEAMGSLEVGARELLISTEQDQTGVLVAVRDSGPGIDPSHLEQVFDAFYTTKPNGTGMGLSICRSIIHDHGGKLWAQPNEPRGAAFQFRLPGAERDITRARMP